MTEQQSFIVELVGNVVLSADSATAGPHSCLDYIPGAVFLGIAAGLYDAVGSYAWELFHTGAVRFGNALPLDRYDAPTVPVPASWFTTASDVNGQLNAASIRNFVRVRDIARPFDAQHPTFEPFRGGFVSRSGQLTCPRQVSRDGNAIEREKFGHSAEGALFPYSSLLAGQRFRWALEWDASRVCSDKIEQLVNRLTGRHRIGRSKRAEYGRVRIDPAPRMEEAHVESHSQETLVGATSLSFLLVADAAFVDPTTGCPELWPKASCFGLPEAWPLDHRRSFLDHRRYAPFNGKRRAFDADRYVLRAGSVLTFRAPGDGAGLSSNAEIRVRRQASVGVGLYRQEGLGRVLLEPQCLQSETPTFVSRPQARPPARGPARTDVTDDPLVPWLVARRAESERQRRIQEQARAAIDSMQHAYKSEGRGPGPSQWSALEERVALLSTIDEVDDALNDPKRGFFTSGVVRRSWREYRPFATRIQELVEEAQGALAEGQEEEAVLAELRDTIRWIAKGMREFAVREVGR